MNSSLNPEEQAILDTLWNEREKSYDITEYLLEDVENLMFILRILKIAGINQLHFDGYDAALYAYRK